MTVWSVRGGEAVTTLGGHSGAVNLLALDRSGSRIVRSKRVSVDGFIPDEKDDVGPLHDC